MKRSLNKYNDGGKTKKPTKAKLYFTVDDLAKGENYVTPEYLKEVDKRRNDWNEFVEFLKKENVYGSEALDKSGAGLGYLKKWNKANPDKTFTEEDIKDVQYFSRKRKGAEGERVNDGVLGKVTSTFTFPDSRVNTYEMKDGKKVLVKSEDPNIGNYQYQADKINFNIASKNKADVSKLPIYNQNSVKEGVAFGQDKSADELLKNEFKKRSLSGQSLSKPKEFVKPLVATENHPAVKEQLEGSYFDNNQKVVDYNTNLQQQKQAEIQQQIDTRSALQKKLDTSKGKDFTKEEALDYFLETGKILPQNKVQAKYTRNKDNQIIGINNKPLYETESYRNLKDLGYNIKEEIKSNYRNAEWDIGARALLSGAVGIIPAMVAPIPTAAVAGAWLAEPAVTGLAEGVSKTLKKKTKRIKNEEFGMPSFEDDNSGLTQKREGGYIEYDNGGKVKPIVVNNPNDPRLRAYGDSLNLYKITKNIENPKYYKHPKSTLFGSSFKGDKKEFNDFIKNYNIQNRNVTLNNYPGKIKPIDYNIFTEGLNYPIYKKPVQPVVYQPATAEQIKPLYQEPQLTMPERLELSMNRPNVVQSAEGPTFKQGRKFMRETGLRPGFYEEGGTINNMKKRTLKRYTNAGVVSGVGKAATGASTAGAATTGATVSPNAIGAGIGFGAEMVGALIPEKQYTDNEGNDLGSRKSIGESTLEYGAKGAAISAMLGGADFGASAVIGAGYGAVKGWMDKEEMDAAQKEANFKIDQRNMSRRMNTNTNWGNSNINTSTNMMFAQGGMVLDYDDPNANAELELQETFQMPDGTVGNVDGPSHEMGGIAVDLPEGTRIWSDKLKHNGKTFAKHTKPITNKIARLEKQIAKNPVNSEAKENSIALLNDQLDYYFDTQETNKQNNEMKKSLKYKEGGIHIKPENKGKFTAYAKSHGKGVQEMARTVLANKENYSPTIVKRANFAKNAAGWKHEMGGLVKYELAGEIGNPDRVAVGAINPRTGQPYTVQEVSSYTDTQGMLPTPFGKQYGGLDNQSRQLYGNYEQNSVIPTSNLKMDSVGAANMQKPSMVTRRSLNQIGSTPTLTIPQRAGTGNYGEFYLPKRGQAYTDAVVENSPITKEEIQQANAMGNFPTGGDNIETPGFFNKAGQFIANNPGLIGQLGTAALSAGIQSGRVNRLARPRTLADVRLSDKIANPNLVDYSAERNAIDRAALNAMSDAQRGFGSSAAAQAFKNKARLNQLEGTGRSFQSQENTNAQIRNQFLNARSEAAMREAMMNNEIDKYNLENTYGFDTMKVGQKNAITAMLGNTASQAFGKQTDFKNQMEQAKILANARERSVNANTVIGSNYEKSYFDSLTPEQKILHNRQRTDLGLPAMKYGGTIKKRSFKK